MTDSETQFHGTPASTTNDAEKGRWFTRGSGAGEGNRTAASVGEQINDAGEARLVRMGVEWVKGIEPPRA